MQSASKFKTEIEPTLAKTALQFTTTFAKNSATTKNIGVENKKHNIMASSRTTNITENNGKIIKLLIIAKGTSLKEQYPTIGKMPIVALIVREKDVAKNFGNFNLSKNLLKLFDKSIIPNTAPKESKKPTSNKYNG